MIKGSEITVMIAAGGRSKRFGQDKATFVHQGERMVDRIARVAGAVSARPVLLGMPPRRRDEPRPWTDLEAIFEIVRDDPEGIGPMGCLNAALNRATTPWLLLVACDLPRLEYEHFETLLAAADCEAVAISAVGSSGHPEPLCTVYHQRIAAQVSLAIGAKDYAMHRLLSVSGAQHVLLPDVALHNMNFPSQAD